MRKSFALLAWLCVSLAGVSQQNAETPISTFESKTELVLVPAVVSDGSGKHIPNLTKDDFSIFEDHQERKIAFFEEVTPKAHAQAPPPRNLYTNHLDTDQTSARLTIFAFDMVNTSFMGQVEVRKILLQTLAKTLDDGEPKAVVVFTRSGIRVLHDFTNDTASLARALRRFTAAAPDITNIQDPVDDSVYRSLSEFTQPSNTEYNEFQQRAAVEATDDCFRQIATAFAGVPGRKALLWATEGFPFLMLTDVGGGKGTGFTAHFGDVPRYQKTWHMLNAANVAVYPIDVRQVTFPGFADASVSRPSIRTEAWQAANREQGTTSMENYAQETGGKACIGRMEFSGCFQEALQESSSYYLIGYYLDKSTKPGWHKLQVKSKVNGAKIRARTGVEIPDPARKQELKNDYEMALLSPLVYTGVPMSLKWIGVSGAPDGKASAAFELLIPPMGFEIDESDGNHMNIELTAIARDSKGAESGLRGKVLEARFKPESAARILREGFVYRNTVEVTPGEYSVRFVVRDNLTGRIGSVSAPLKLSAGTPTP